MRTQTASLFRQLENGHIHIEDVLRSPPRYLLRVSVFDVLRRAPKLGRTGSEKLLMKCDMWPLRKLGEMPLREREIIIEELPPRAQKG